MSGRASRSRASSDISRRHFLRQASAKGAAAGAFGLAAPGIWRSADAQGASTSRLDNVSISIAVGSTEFLWTVLKGRKIDEKFGFNVDVSYSDSEAINQGLMTGRVDIGSAQIIPVAIANNAGKNITFFAPALWNHTIGITYAESPGSTLKDFVGKRIATLPALSGTYTSIQVIVAELGMNFEKDFTIVTGPPPIVLAFLKRGDVDGVVHFEPFVSSLLLTGKYKTFFEPNQIWKQLTGQNMLFAGLGANQKWLDANRDLAKRMTAAVLDAGKLIQSDPSVFDQFPKPLDLKNPEEIATAKKRLPPFFPTEWDPASVTNAYHLVERGAALGVVSKPARDFIVAL